MRAATLVAIALVPLAFATGAKAADSPTTPDEKDKLCEVIGEAPNISIPPKDRLWFKENCSCIETVGCGSLGSPRFKARQDGVRMAAQNAEARRKAEGLAQARKACARFTDCLHTNVNSLKACSEVASWFEGECSAGIRDYQECGRIASELTKSPATADCGPFFK